MKCFNMAILIVHVQCKVPTSTMGLTKQGVSRVAHTRKRAGRVIADVVARRADVTLVDVDAREPVGVDLVAARADALEAADGVHAVVRAALS